VAGLLRGLGREEIESILEEQGAVTVTCEFCQKPYRFDAVDAAQLFLPAAAEGKASLN
jgi:molecular chaperone Hsp33